MTAPPWFKLYAAEWLADEKICCLSLEERGALVTLWAFCWREGSIPADPAKLARLLGVTPADYLARLEPGISPFFAGLKGDDSRLVSERMEREFQASAERSEKLREAGARGGKAKRDNFISHQARLEPGKSRALAKGYHKESDTEKEGNTPLPPSGDLVTRTRPKRRGKGVTTTHLRPEAEAPFARIWAMWPKDKEGRDTRGHLLPGERAFQAILDSKAATAEELEGAAKLYLARSPKVREGYIQEVSTFFGAEKGTWAEALRYLRGQGPTQGRAE